MAMAMAEADAEAAPAEEAPAGEAATDEVAASDAAPAEVELLVRERHVDDVHLAVERRDDAIVVARRRQLRDPDRRSTEEAPLGEGPFEVTGSRRVSRDTGGGGTEQSFAAAFNWLDENEQRLRKTAASLGNK